VAILSSPAHQVQAISSFWHPTLYPLYSLIKNFFSSLYASYSSQMYTSPD